MPFDARFSERVCAAVSEVEKASSVEVVIVVAPRSGSYADVDLKVGIATALVALAIILYGPWVFAPEPILLDVVLAGLAGWAFSRYLPSTRRLLTSARRQRRQVEEAAARLFLEHGVHATRERTGVLIYLSQLERTGFVLPDLGLDGQVPRAVWSELKQDLAQASRLEHLEQGLFRGLDLLKERLPAYLPPGEDNPDEIPNAPRMLT